MPATNDQGVQVSTVEDFIDLDKWIAPKDVDFRKVTGTRIVNPNNFDMGDIYGYIPDTFSEFAVKNVLKDKAKGIVSQEVSGPWEDTKMQIVMAKIDLKLNNKNPNKPYLEDNHVKVMCEDGVELQFTGGWFVRGWKVELVVKENDNGVKEVELFRDQIKWVKADHKSKGSKGPKTDKKSPQKPVAEDGIELFTCTYWFPY